MKVSVVGGSLGGLTAAALFSHHGFDVTVFERSPSELVQRGAGIGLMPETSRFLTDIAKIPIDDISVQTHRIRYIDISGKVVHDEPHAYRFSSWNTIYRQLMSCIKPDTYNLGHEMTDWTVNESSATVRFANGRSATSDLLVFADGVNSLARSRLLPDARPRYAGYVAWRGMVHERELPANVRHELDDAITYALYANSHILVYPIPGHDGEVTAGHRLFNFVWYRNYSVGSDLDALMTDAQGMVRDVSLPPGSAATHHIAELRATAAARLPAVIAEVVQRTEQPFVQVVFDLSIQRMAFGRSCLIGDAAFLGRPHAAAGTAKAADDAWALVQACLKYPTIEEALAAWEVSQLRVGQQLYERTERIGRRSQVDNNWIPGDPELIFGLKGAGE